MNSFNNYFVEVFIEWLLWQATDKLIGAAAITVIV